LVFVKGGDANNQRHFCITRRRSCVEEALKNTGAGDGLAFTGLVAARKRALSRIDTAKNATFWD
jgi:hypothetical protein